MDPIYFRCIAGIIVISAFYVSANTEILKDMVITSPQQVPTKTYSFSRTQGLWWTTIIASCFIIAFGENGKVINLNATCLTLLGIGVSTTAIGKVIDNYDLKGGFVRYQDVSETKNFFKDILWDGTGISVSRYQSLVFNLIFTVVFIIEFFKDTSVFPIFNEATLGLLGISSSVYLGVKATENQEKGTTLATTSKLPNNIIKSMANADTALNDFNQS